MESRLALMIVSGYEAATELRNTAWGQRLKLVALTGWGQDSDRQRTKEAHFDFHLVKPAGIEQIQRSLSQLEGAGF
jgi:CheY-like chemotaxis protein